MKIDCFPFFSLFFFLLLLLLVLHIVTHTQRKERGALQFSFASSSSFVFFFFWNYIHNKRRLYDGKMIRVSKLYSKNESCVCLLAEWCVIISTVKMYLQKIIKKNSNYSLKCHSLFPFSISILSFLYIISELLLFEFKTTTHLDECKNGATSNYLIVKLHYNI